MSTRVLLVEPNPGFLSVLRRSGGTVAETQGATDFATARIKLFSSGDPFNLLVTNLRLRAYNGLHLVYLTNADESGTRSVVYTDRFDLQLAREVQHAGAFYETRDRVVHSLISYVRATLPSEDRRDPALRDRRAIFRGGRRVTDQHSLALA